MNTPEHLAFNYHADRGTGRPAIEETFATTDAAAEPRDWGYLGLLAFTTVLLLRPQDRVPALGPMHVAEICALLGIGPMLLHRFARRLPVFRVTPETLGLIVLGAAILATAPFSIWPGGAVQVFTDSYLKIVIVFVLMMNTLTTTARLERLTWLILVCTGVIAALAVRDYASGRNLVEGNRLAGPVGGIFGNPNDLAMNMTTFLPATIVVALSARRSPPRRVTAAVIALLMVATIIFTKSRGGLLGLTSAMLALWLMSGRIRGRLTAMAIAGVLLAGPLIPASFWARMTTIVNPEEDRQFTGSREARELVMGDGLNTFLEFPITGVGAGQFKNYNPSDRQAKYLETHNVLLQVAAELGIVGLLAFVFLLWRAAMAAWTTERLVTDKRWMALFAQRGKEDDGRALSEHTIGLTAGLVGWFVCAMFASVAYNWTFYYVLALLVAARELATDQLRVAIPATLKKIPVRAAALST